VGSHFFLLVAFEEMFSRYVDLHDPIRVLKNQYRAVSQGARRASAHGAAKQQRPLENGTGCTAHGSRCDRGRRKAFSFFKAFHQTGFTGFTGWGLQLSPDGKAEESSACSAKKILQLSGFQF
jgi:hypothetical protein